MEERRETAQLLKQRDADAVRLKASLALEIARSRGDGEMVTKYRELNDPAAFWAYVAATRPSYTNEACVEFGRRACRDRRSGLAV